METAAAAAVLALVCEVLGHRCPCCSTQSTLCQETNIVLKPSAGLANLRSLLFYTWKPGTGNRLGVSVDEWIKEMCYNYTVESYSAVKKRQKREIHR